MRGRTHENVSEYYNKLVTSRILVQILKGKLWNKK